VAPEARDRKRATGNSDVYSLGIMLLELLTGRRPALGAPLPELRVGDPFSQEIGAFLKVALAPSEERYPSISEMRRALQETKMAAPKLLYPAGLAFYLYKLLNPESTGVPPADADSTNPVETEPRLAGDSDALPAVEPPSVYELPAEFRAPREEPFDLTPAEISEAVGDDPAADDGESPEPAFPAEDGVPPLPAPEGVLTPALLEAARPRRPIRAGGTGALLLLAGSVFGLALLIDNERARRVTAPDPEPAPVEVAVETPEPADRVLPPMSPEPPAAAPDPVPVIREMPPAPAPPAAERVAARVAARARRLEQESSRRLAEDLRFQAGLARIAAQRLDGAEIAAGTFLEASDREHEGESLYRQGEFEAARGAFEDATRLYREAESISHEERVRRVK
jgi:hypothetical protein